MKMHEHNGWKIGLTPSQRDDGRWSSRIEVFEPGTDPRHHVGMALRFNVTVTTEQEVSPEGARSCPRVD